MKYRPCPVENKLQNLEVTQDGAVCAKQSAHNLLREHVETLANLLSDADISIIILRGGMGVKARREVEARLHYAQMATGKDIGKGLLYPDWIRSSLSYPPLGKGG